MPGIRIPVRGQIYGLAQWYLLRKSQKKFCRLKQRDHFLRKPMHIIGNIIHKTDSKDRRVGRAKLSSLPDVHRHRRWHIHRHEAGNTVSAPSKTFVTSRTLEKKQRYYMDTYLYRTRQEFELFHFLTRLCYSLLAPDCIRAARPEAMTLLCSENAIVQARVLRAAPRIEKMLQSMQSSRPLLMKMRKEVSRGERNLAVRSMHRQYRGDPA